MKNKAKLARRSAAVARVKELCSFNRPIDAIKHLRQVDPRLGLKEAYDLVKYPDQLSQWEKQL